MILKKIIYIFFFLFWSESFANELNQSPPVLYLKLVVLILFCVCYILVMFEELIKFKKSEVTIFFSILILIIVAFFSTGNLDYINKSLNKFLLEYCELFLFLFVAMIYINSLKKLYFFDFIKELIFSKNLSYKKIYFLTGFLSFFISPIADNLTTALLMTSVILSIECKNTSFINLSCINIVMAANAGGVFSPFGDITTLMIWQSGLLDFFIFFKLFIPAFISFLVPSIIMSFYIPVYEKLESVKPSCAKFKLNFDSKCVIFLFLITIFFAVLFQSCFKIPSVFGMMFGLSLLQFFFIFKKITLSTQIAQIEWDTLLFFYGIMLCISMLDFVGILKNIADFLYLNNFFSFYNNHTYANILIGFLSAIIDNIPITFAIINMNLDMNDGQWLLLTYTVATGGSLLSIGSAAGIAVMGKAKNNYTFYSHFKWSGVIFIGYICGIILHLILNKKCFI